MNKTTIPPHAQAHFTQHAILDACRQDCAAARDMAAPPGGGWDLFPHQVDVCRILFGIVLFGTPHPLANDPKPRVPPANPGRFFDRVAGACTEAMLELQVNQPDVLHRQLLPPDDHGLTPDTPPFRNLVDSLLGLSTEVALVIETDVPGALFQHALIAQVAAFHGAWEHTCKLLGEAIS